MILQLIFFQIITFVVIIAILRFVFGSQLKVALNRLESLHQESLEKEEILNKEIDRARAQSQSEIARSKEEARLIIDNARKNAERIAQDGVAQAHLQAKKMLIEAQQNAKSLEGRIRETASEKAVGIARDLIAAVFSERGQAVMHEQLIEELLDELDKVDRGRLAADATTAQVTSAQMLAPSQKERLKSILTSKTGRDISLEEKIDPALVEGVVITMGGIVIDGSLQNKLQKVLDARKTGSG